MRFGVLSREIRLNDACMVVLSREIRVLVDLSFYYSILLFA